MSDNLSDVFRLKHFLNKATTELPSASEPTGQWLPPTEGRSEWLFVHPDGKREYETDEEHKKRVKSEPKKMNAKERRMAALETRKRMDEMSEEDLAKFIKDKAAKLKKNDVTILQAVQDLWQERLDRARGTGYDPSDLSPKDIAKRTGLSEAAISTSIKKLYDVGALHYRTAQVSEGAQRGRFSPGQEGSVGGRLKRKVTFISTSGYTKQYLEASAE